MRRNGRPIGWGLALGVAMAGCGLAHERGADVGTPHGDASAGPDAAGAMQCGAVTCAVGTLCCNPSCGICMPPGIRCSSLACEDAGPIARRCGGRTGTRCEPAEYCAYSDTASCGNGDQTGICRPRPVACPDPGGNWVCGCDGNDYLGECSAYLAGTDVARQGRCLVHPTPVRPAISATPRCGPFDGPEWTFVISEGGPPVCALPTNRASLQIDVWGALEGASPGTPYMIGGDFESLGQARYCAGGGGDPPCWGLTGVLVVDSFVASSTATFSYALRSADGMTYSGSHVSVDTWCAGQPICG